MLDMPQIWKRRVKNKLKGSEGLVYPVGTASCFGYKGAILKITLIKHTEGMRSQWQEATTKTPVSIHRG